MYHAKTWLCVRVLTIWESWWGANLWLIHLKGILCVYFSALCWQWEGYQMTQERFVTQRNNWDHQEGSFPKFTLTCRTFWSDQDFVSNSTERQEGTQSCTLIEMLADIYSESHPIIFNKSFTPPLSRNLRCISVCLSDDIKKQISRQWVADSRSTRNTEMTGCCFSARCGKK